MQRFDHTGKSQSQPVPEPSNLYDLGAYQPVPNASPVPYEPHWFRIPWFRDPWISQIGYAPEHNWRYPFNFHPFFYEFQPVKWPSLKIKTFRPLPPSTEDKLLLPRGFRSDIVAAWGDDLGNGERFGYNNDFTAFFPLNEHKEGLLWVNHEYIGNGAVYVSGYTGKGPRTIEQIEKEKYNVGGSVLHIRQVKGKWELVKGSMYNRRITASTPIRLTGPAAGTSAVHQATEVTGTFANCSGGTTPWNTVLSCEENTEEMVKEWAPAGTLDPTHYGWIVEIDPSDPRSVPKKHTALGRFAHENAAVAIGKTGRIVVYSGDDAADQCIYKYISDEPYQPEAGKQNSRLLEKGTLYAAEFGSGRWIPLDLWQTPKLKEKFETQAEVLVRVREAAALIKATPLDRPEDIEIHPKDGSVYVALTNNLKHGNYYGQIIRLIEADGDAESLSFRFEIFATGGPQSGFACPDNLLFDKLGNLWVTTDISSSALNKGAYDSFGNNGLYLIPTEGPDKGAAFRFASAPFEAELTGPWFAPDGKTLFLSVQHPGEETTDPLRPTSRWPYGSVPRPTVIAITGF